MLTALLLITVGCTGAPADTTTPTSVATTTPVAGDACPDPGTPTEPTGPSVTAELVDDGDVRIEAAVYPLPDHDGNPWSQWGLGAITPDGRFLSAVGDHLGRDGNSYLYQYDPHTGDLTLVTDLLSVIGHQPGDWGYGKVHSRIVVDDCGIGYFTTYWGTRRDIEFTAGYEGDHLVKWDTRSHRVETLGVPVPEHGIPSINADFARGFIYGEAVDPASDPDAGLFFARDLATDETTVFAIDGHIGFRDVLVTSDGDACVATDGSMTCWDPIADRLATLGTDGWLRASTEPGPDGTVYGATREPDAFFALHPDGGVEPLGEARGYTAAMALDPSGDRFFHVPHAHGGSWEDGTPLIAVDTATGDEEVIALLAPGVLDAFDLYLGGTYSIATDGSVVYVAMNAGEDEESFGSVVLVIVHL